MTLPQQKDLFLDTSIQIARQVHGRKTKEGIERRLGQYSNHVTSFVVRQEFRRRLLKEAQYLLGLLEKYESFSEVFQHVNRLYDRYHKRKRIICLQMLQEVYGNDDDELTERLPLYLRSLLVSGLRRFDQQVDQIVTGTNCACGRRDIIEKKPLKKYEFGTDDCSQTSAERCGITKFLIEHKDLASKVLAHFRSLSTEKKSDEIKSAEEFLAAIVDDTSQLQKQNLCLTAGDLLIAFESSGISHFLTLNSKESQHFCRVLDQTLIVYPIDPLKLEIICDAGDPNWPEFGA